MLFLPGTTPLNSIVTGGVVSSSSASYENDTMLAIAESRTMVASTKLRKHLVRNGLISCYKIAQKHFGDDLLCSLDIKAVLSAN